MLCTMIETRSSSALAWGRTLTACILLVAGLCLSACSLDGSMDKSRRSGEPGPSGDTGGAAGSEDDADSGTPSAPTGPAVFDGDPEQLGGMQVIHDKDGLTIPNPGLADINAGLFVPSTDGQNMASGKKLPLLIVHPGFGAQWRMHTEFCEHLASWGYLVIAINHSGLGQDHMLNAQQTLATIDWAKSEASGLKDAADTARVATIGHSMGGKIALLSAYLDAGAHIKVIIGWDPVTQGGPMMNDDPTAVLPDKIKELGQPYLIFGAAGGSCSPEGGNAQAIFDAAHGNTEFLHFPMANHMDWVDLEQSDTVGGIGGVVCGGQSGVPMDVHRITKRTQVAWLKRHLEGLKVSEAYFDPDGPILQPDIARGLITVSVK